MPGGSDGVRGEHGAALTHGPVAQCAWFTRFENKLKIRIQTRSNNFKFSSNFDSSKRCLPLLQKFQIKYGWKELEMRNNFS
jgi:hypothetical protein